MSFEQANDFDEFGFGVCGQIGHGALPAAMVVRRPRGAHFRYHRDVMRSRVVGVVPAAGRGVRFAEADPAAPPKMLAQVDGAPMVRRTVESLISGGVDHCVVVVSSHDSAPVDGVEQALQGLPVRLVINPDPARGMFSSVQCGVMATRDSDLCVLLPGDMPFVQPSTIAAVIAATLDGAETITPSLDGHRGHPVACSSALRALILTAPSDARLDHLMGQDAVRLVEVTDTGVRRDVDRPPAAASAGA